MSSWSLLVRPALTLTGRGKLNILVYHRVHSQPDPLFPEAIDVRGFDRHLSWISNTLNALPLGEAVEMLEEARLPPRAVSITFDDGYADNAEAALPILRHHRLPATFFVATGYLEGGRMWNNTIIEAIRRADGTMLDLGFQGLGTYRIDTPQARREAIERVIGQMKYLPAQSRQVQVDALAHEVGQALPNDLMMRSEQVRELHQAGMTIGGHTVTHPILKQLDTEQARSEILEGREALESITGTRVSLFAYPNGKPGKDYGPEHVAMVQELGFRAALSTHWAAADSTSDLFQLPRFTPWGESYLGFGIGLARSHLGRI